MFGIGMPELMVVLIIALVIFGATKLPQIGKGLGQGIREFKKAIKVVSEEPEEEIHETDKKKGETQE
jgi:sec-independent protein translocase protein TatA